MNKIVLALLLLHPIFCQSQKNVGINGQDTLLQKIILEPSQQEVDDILFNLRQKSLFPKNVIVHDSLVLDNTNKLYILSHSSDDATHYGAVVVPKLTDNSKLPVIVFAAGGDGVHTELDISKDFNHSAVQFPNFLGEKLDEKFIVAVPSFRGQQLIVGDKKYQSGGKVSDAFNGATTDALGFLNVVLENFHQADKNRIAIFGGSRGGTVALLASARDQRIKKAIVVAAPTDMRVLYELYPDQFQLLFFHDLLSGSISESEARRRFIASSPIYFVNELPVVQLHHDIEDPFVPVHFAKNLACEMVKNYKDVRINFYQENIHGFWSDRRYWARVQDFVKQW